VLCFFLFSGMTTNNAVYMINTGPEAPFNGNNCADRL
jgi:hypothetical protein